MSRRFALVLVADQEGGDAKAIGKALARIDVPASQQVALVGPAVTKSAVESRIRKIAASASAGDILWLVFVGAAFVEQGRIHLQVADTLEDDQAATSLLLDDILTRLNQAEFQIRLVLDCAQGLPRDPLDDAFEDGDAVALVASVDGQPSQTVSGRRLWLQMLMQAIAGEIGSEEESFTAASINAFLRSEMPKVLRKNLVEVREQVPHVFGAIEATLGERKPAKRKPKLDLKKLKRIAFRGNQSTKVRDLRGFKKNFRLPDSASASQQRQVLRMAEDDLKADIDEKYNRLREQLGFKRKDLETSIASDGFASIRTPAFDYSVAIRLDETDPTNLIWQREIGQIADPDVLQAPGFRDVFGSMLDSLSFDFENPVDLEVLVDRLEADIDSGLHIRVSSDLSECQVTPMGFAGIITITPQSMQIAGRPGCSPEVLVEQFFQFQTRYGGRKGLPALSR